MTRKELENRLHLERVLESLGFTADETRSLIRIEMTLHRWSEHECNGNIQRDESKPGADDGEGKPRWRYSGGGKGYLIADRERGALARAKKIIDARNDRVPDGKGLLAKFVSFYHQGDPRGAALYILRPGDVPEGKDPGAYYSHGICVCGR